MTAKKLTDLQIENLAKPKGKAPRMVWDAVEPGLIAKVTPAGKKVWALRAVYPGSTLRTIRTLGTFPALKVAKARERARKWKAWIAENIDPEEGEAKERQQQEEARRAEAQERARETANSFRKVAEDYVADRRAWKTRNRRIDDDAREIERDLILEWGDRPISSIKPADVRKLVDKLRAGFKDSKGRLRKGSDRNASTAWNHAEQIFKWAVHRELLDASPCASISKRQLFKGADLGSRQRVLDETEIAALWRAAGRLGYPMGQFYRLLLLTSLRKSELAEAKWSEIHPELRKVLRHAAAKEKKVEWAKVPDAFKLLTIDKDRFKSDAAHIVPLSNLACSILEDVPRFAGSDWIFTEGGEGAVNGFSKSKARLDAAMLSGLRALARKRGDDPKSVKLEGWVQHDLRRVVKTNLADLKVPDHVSELILGHARKGLQGVYDRHGYMTERREALERWAARVREIAGPRPAAPEPRTIAGSAPRLSIVR